MLVAHAGGSGSESLAMLLATWERAPGLALIAILVTLGYLRALGATTLRLRYRILRGAAWCSAMGAVVLALGSPVDALGAHLVSAHMVQHMLLADLAPALAVYALGGGVATVLARVLGRTPLALIARAARRVPLTLVVGVWAATWGFWHTTWAYQLALDVAPVHALEHGSLLVVGAWLWTVIVDPLGTNAGRVPARIGVAVGALFFGAVLTNTLTYVDEPAYTALVGESERLLGWSSIADQQLAALVMLGGQAVTLGAALFVLVRRHLADGAGISTRGADLDSRDALVDGGRRHPVGW